MLRRHLTLSEKPRLIAATLVAVGLGCALVSPSAAQEAQSKRDVFSVFKFGFFAEKRGEKEQAAQAYRDAASQGHKGARWKLANMYADGDGVAEDDLEAFRMYERIVREGAEPGTKDASFVADALVSLSDYIRQGIPDTPISADPRRARELLWQAAANFGQPTAQFKLGKMFLKGEGGAADPRQAARWFNLSAQKGHSGAKAMLGHMLFERGKTVRGLAMMTQALDGANKDNRGWIRQMQEEAFAVSSEAERRTAIALAEGG